VVFFGDSVSLRVSRNDRDVRTLGEMVARTLSDKMRVVCIHRGAYHIGVFNAFVRKDATSSASNRDVPEPAKFFPAMALAPSLAIR
jgi:hypothetical protein